MNLNKIKQPFIKAFPGDFSGNPMQRQTPEMLFATTAIAGFPDAELLFFNEKLAEEIGLGKIENEADINFLNATKIPHHITTYATAYAGHQFGNWAGQLGDGRAIFAGEIQNKNGRKTEVQWKGAGATPYSRHADGRAVLRSTVREYLMSEAMHFLRVPTTRSLSLSLSGENVMRDILYDGHPKFEKGAVMIRTAESFLRFGHFELLSAQNDLENLKKLVHYTIENYFPDITADGAASYLAFFRKVAERTADLMVEWYRVGFVHGVMNTDNMSILGLTIDYGPFSFLDEYSLNFTPNTTDLPGRRYAFGRQAAVAQWNLLRLANALFPLIKDEQALEDILNNFTELFWTKHDAMMAAKFGFASVMEKDSEFFTYAQQILEQTKADYTLFFTQLQKLQPETDIKSHFSDIFYENPSETTWKTFLKFIESYRERSTKNLISKEDSLKIMAKTNPKFVLRNYLLFECIAELDEGKKDMFRKLLIALENPYEEIFPEFSAKRPAIYDEQSGCSTLSCSS